MRIETKMLKKFLKELYPNQRFSVTFVSAKSYIDTSDKLKVKCSSNLSKKKDRTNSTYCFNDCS